MTDPAPTPKPVIALTGGTGFIGRRLCHHLLRRGHAVRVLARSRRKARALQRAGAEIVPGHLDDPHALSRLVTDSHHLIHCAGTVRGRTLADFLPANVRGIENLLAASRASEGPRRLLVMSSLAARQPELSDYAHSKWLGEQTAFDNAGDLAVSVFRPAAVYGPGDRELLPLLRLMRLGLALAPGDPGDRVSLIYVDDLTRAVLSWLALEPPPRQVFPLCDPATDGYSWRELAAIAGRVLDRRVRVASPPAGLLNGLARANLALARGLNYAPMLTPGKLRELRHPDWRCDYRAYARASDWRPRVPFSRGLVLTLGRRE